MKKNKSWKVYIVLFGIALLTGIGLTVSWDGVGLSHAKKDSPEWIFGGSTPRSFADLAQGVQSAVVNISTTKNLNVRRGPYYRFQEDYFRKHFQGQDGKITRPNSLGSGFILNEEGFILTNNHVIQGADEILVKLSDGRTFKARTVGGDSKTDLAVIKIDTRESLPTVRLGDSDALKIGDWVVAIGNPFGLTQTVTAGILSAKGRVIGAGPYDNFLQTDASINPGNSGGPLFNLQGEVVGVNTAIIAGGQGIGFAIPINMAKAIVPQLMEKGRVNRGYLGIGLQEVTSELAKSLGFSKPEGILVSVVYEGSPAHRAGIRAGDLILKFNGKAIERNQDLPIFVSQSPVGTKAKIQLWRDGQVREVEVSIGSMEQGTTQPVKTGSQEKVIPNNLGVAVRDIKPVESQKYGLAPGEGVQVTGVQRGSPAAGVGLQPGDLILEINDQEIKGSREFIQSSGKLRRGQIVRLYVRRGLLASYFAFVL